MQQQNKTKNPFIILLNYNLFLETCFMCEIKLSVHRLSICIFPFSWSWATEIQSFLLMVSSQNLCLPAVLISSFQFRMRSTLHGICFLLCFFSPIFILTMLSKNTTNSLRTAFPVLLYFYQPLLNDNSCIPLNLWKIHIYFHLMFYP